MSEKSVGRRRFLAGASLAGAAALTASATAEAQTTVAPKSDKLARMADELTADEVRTLLKLEPHPTCGFVRETYLSTVSIAPGGLPAPFADGRPMGSALYFMVTAGASVRLHRIRNDQLYHYYLGDPLEVVLLRGDGASERVIVGPDLRRGQRVQLLIPGNTFHTARVIGDWFLGASTEWPGVIPADVEVGNLDELAGKYPAVAADLRAIAQTVRH